eukprot:m.1678056 g.1678056  ORF g.1678056 m.1678056 type:complete len:54 (+) comp201037_c0_seq1:35-196(+)
MKVEVIHEEPKMLLIVSISLFTLQVQCTVVTLVHMQVQTPTVVPTERLLLLLI